MLINIETATRLWSVYALYHMLSTFIKSDKIDSLITMYQFCR